MTTLKISLLGSFHYVTATDSSFRGPLSSQTAAATPLTACPEIKCAQPPNNMSSARHCPLAW